MKHGPTSLSAGLRSRPDRMSFSSLWAFGKNTHERDHTRVQPLVTHGAFNPLVQLRPLRNYYNYACLFVYLWMYRLTLLFITFPESQTSDVQIISCKPSDPNMCTNGDLVKLAGYDATTTLAGTRKAWRMMSAELLCILSSGQVAVWFLASHVFVTYLPYCFSHCFMTTKKAAHRCRELTALSGKSDSVKAETRARISQKQLSTVLSRWDCGCIFKPWSRHNAAR